MCACGRYDRFHITSHFVQLESHYFSDDINKHSLFIVNGHARITNETLIILTLRCREVESLTSASFNYKYCRSDQQQNVEQSSFSLSPSLSTRWRSSTSCDLKQIELSLANKGLSCFELGM